MKKFLLMAAVLLSLNITAQNWINRPGFYAANTHHIAWFYDDTATNRLIGYGQFDTIGNVPVQNIAAWDGNSWSAILPQMLYHNDIVSVIRYNGNLLLSGYFYSWNVNTPYIAKWDGTTLDSFTVINHGSCPTGMLQYQNDLIVYGYFDTIDNVPVHNIARWNGVNWSDLGSGIFYVDVAQMIAYHGDLYAAAVSSVDMASHVFRLVGNIWQPVGQSFNGTCVLQTLCIYNDELYVGGCFSLNDNPSSAGNAIAKLDTVSDTWTNVGGGLISSSFEPTVSEMTIHDGALYVIGGFDHAGGVPASSVAKWDGTQWCSFGIGFSYALFNIADYDDSLYLSTDLVFDNNNSSGFVQWIGGNYTDTCGVISTGMNEQVQQHFSVTVFPNPATTNATFKMENSDGNKTLIIYDQLGKEIWRKETVENEIEFSTEGFAMGLYFYRMEREGEIITSGKLVIE